MRAVLMRVAIGLIFAGAKAAFAYSCQTNLAHLITVVPPITVPDDLPVGSEIGQAVVNYLPPYKCLNSDPKLDKQEMWIQGYGTHVATFNGRRIYNTNVKGIGYAVGATFSGCPSNNVYWVTGKNTENPDRELMCYVRGMFGSMLGYVYIQFFKTAQKTEPGVVLARDMAGFLLRNNGVYWASPVSYLSVNAFKVNGPSCTLGNKVINVNMGDISRQAFGGPGRWPTDSNTKAFSVSLRCAAWLTVSFQIDGSVKDAARGLLNLSADAAAAKGIALQVLYDNQPVKLGSRVVWHTIGSDGNYAIPFTARYVQTDASVTPGVANAAATFTISYQ